MATKAQIDANRQNSQRSTGPVTPEGKAKSCMNRLSHGFNSSNIFIALEEKEEFDALLADLINQFQPATPNEQILVEKMMQNHWLSLRAVRLQSLVLLKTVPAGYIQKDLGVLVRYQHASERGYHKAHEELVKEQKQREKSTIGFESENVAEPVEAAPKTERNPPPEPQNAPENAPQAAPQPVEPPDFTPCELQLAGALGITVAELMAAA